MEAKATKRWQEMTPDPSSRLSAPGLAVSFFIAIVSGAALLWLAVADGADNLNVGGRVTATVALVGLAYAISTIARLKVQSNIARSRFSEAWIDLQKAVAAKLPIAEHGTQIHRGDEAPYVRTPSEDPYVRANEDPYLTACLRAGVLKTSDVWLLRFWRDRIMDERVRVSASVVGEVTQILESAIAQVSSFGNHLDHGDP
jgi:hypothetical protein